MLGKIESKRRRGKQGMRWLNRITNSVDMNLKKFWETVEDGGAWRAMGHRVAKSQTRLSNWATIATTTASLNRWILSEKTWTVPVCLSSHRPSILPENCPYFVSVFLPSPRQLLYIILSYLKLPVPFSETAHLRDLRILSQILWWKWNNNHQPLPFSSLTIRHASLAYPTSLHFLQWR